MIYDINTDIIFRYDTYGLGDFVVSIKREFMEWFDDNETPLMILNIEPLGGSSKEIAGSPEKMTFKNTLVNSCKLEFQSDEMLILFKMTMR